MISNIGSTWCSLEEEHYLTLVDKDLASFSTERSVNKVLVFPPLCSRLRFLLHKVVEGLPGLESCSIGSEPNRRTVVYFEEITRKNKTQQSMDGSKLESEPTTKCNPCGRGRGRGIRARGEKQCDSYKDSPAASRRPARPLYTPGAFSKKRHNTEHQTRQNPSPVDPSRNSENETSMSKSCTFKTQDLNEKSENLKPQQVAKSHSRDQQEHVEELESDKNKSTNITIHTEKFLEDNFSKLQVSSLVSSNSVENKSRNAKEKADKHVLLANPTTKIPDQANSNCDDSAGQSINGNCSVDTKVDNISFFSQDCEKNEEIFTQTEDPSHNAASKTIEGNYDNKPSQIEVPTMNDLGTNSAKKWKQVGGAKIDCTESSDQLAEGESNIHDSNEDIEHIVESCTMPVVEISNITYKEMSPPMQALGELNDEADKARLKKNENAMCSKSRENDETQKKEKRQFDKSSINKKEDKISLGSSDILAHVERKTKKQGEDKDSDNKNLNNDNNVGLESYTLVDMVQGKLEIKSDVNNKDDRLPLENNESSVDIEHEGEVDLKSTVVSVAGSGSIEMIQPHSGSKQQIKNEKLLGKDELRHNDESIIKDAIRESIKTRGNVNKQEKILPANKGSTVNTESKGMSDSNNKSKRQHKKDEKAKRKEERLKKKQVKTKSEKSVKRNEGQTCELGNEEKNTIDVTKLAVGEEQTKARVCNVIDSGKKGKSNNEADKQKKATEEADNKEMKTVRECKDTLLKVCVPEDDILNHEDSGEEDDWEKTWNDEGECLDEDLLAELSEKVDTTNVQVVKPQYDYLSFKPSDIILEHGVFDHVVELYDFSPEFKNHDLINALSNFKEQGLDIQWVDDTHALAVFSNHRTAQQAIEQSSNPMLKLRSLYEGTHKSKLKAKRIVDVLRPYKERPKTTKLVANRLVAGALGMKSKMSKEERQLEREKIKAERERKLNKEKQKKDLWDSDDL